MYTIVYYDIFGELCDIQYSASSKEEALDMFYDDGGTDLLVQCVYADE